jgi:branched chain amino acid efflux pump
MTEGGKGGEFWRGFSEGLPLIGAVIPFSLVFGATAVQAGYSVFETVFASATIFAGASQFVFIEVNGLGVPAWSVVLAVFAVNFRHILYSASLGRWMHRFNPWSRMLAFFFMTDFQWAAGEARVHAKGPESIAPSWYFGLTVPLYVLWVCGTIVGAIFGGLITKPEAFGLDFLLPIYFLIILIGFRKRRNFLPVVCVSASVSYLALRTLGEPWHISLGAMAGIAAAAMLPRKVEIEALPDILEEEDG